MSRRAIRVGRRSITISSEEKVLFPEKHISKGDLIAYYQAIAPSMIPYMCDRPVMLHRFPEGINHDGFYQKDASDYFPSWMKFATIKKQDEGSTRYVVCNDAATLVYLTNQLTITYHLWLSKIQKKNYPDRMIFDLDPGEHVTFAAVKKTAAHMKKMLESLDMPSYVMLTGSRGVHIVVPLRPIHTFDSVRTFAHDVARVMSLKHPDLITADVRKEARGKRVFIDYLRNGFAQTSVAPYSVRANKAAAIATPIRWDELLKKRISPQHYTIKTIHRRLSRIQDPWADMQQHACTLSIARKRLNRFLREAQQTT